MTRPEARRVLLHQLRTGSKTYTPVPIDRIVRATGIYYWGPR